MRFDASYFIDLCQKSGFKLSREGGLLLYSTGRKRVEGADLFIDAMRQHKTEIMPLLEDVSAVKQLDLFDS